ncbi:hypothetical protein SB766_29340, partial [Pseudomonas sp. SIMBA_077]
MLSPIARAVLLAFAGLPHLAHAQAAAPANADALSTAASTVLSPVVVTAERGPQALADAIPQTSLFDQQDIADTTATDL